MLSPSDSVSTDDLLMRIRQGDQQALDDALTHERHRLRRMVAIRLDARLRSRLDASDVVQEAYLDIARRLPQFLAEPKMSLFLWMRLVVGEKIHFLHRHHLGAQMRDADREVAMQDLAPPISSTDVLADCLAGNETSPSAAVVRSERLRAVREVLDELDPIDREVLALRHYEQLDRAETAMILGISESACAKRYFRALQRLKEALSQRPGGAEGI